MLREALAGGFAMVEMTRAADAMPAARAQRQGSWQPFMAFPPAVYGQLVEHFKRMAGLGADEREIAGTILVRVAGRDAAIDLRARANERGDEELVLSFPEEAVGGAAS